MNARQEFLNICEDKVVVCASITHEYWSGDFYAPDSILKLDHIKLKCDYTGEEYKKFLDSLDFEYDNGFGTKHIHGMVWFDDGTWATRDEYDGSEWWEVHEMPEIPDNLK